MQVTLSYLNIFATVFCLLEAYDVKMFSQDISLFTEINLKMKVVDVCMLVYYKNIIPPQQYFYAFLNYS